MLLHNLTTFEAKTQTLCLVHLFDQGIDVLLPVTKVTTLNEVLELSAVESTVGV